MTPSDAVSTLLHVLHMEPWTKHPGMHKDQWQKLVLHRVCDSNAVVSCLESYMEVETAGIQVATIGSRPQAFRKLLRRNRNCRHPGSYQSGFLCVSNGKVLTSSNSHLENVGCTAIHSLSYLFFCYQQNKKNLLKFPHPPRPKDVQGSCKLQVKFFCSA